MALITTTAELKQYLSASSALKIDTLQPFINQAERRYLIPLIGQAQYNLLLAAYNAAENNASAITNADLKALCLIAQESVANLCLMVAIPQLSVLLSDAGIRRNDGTDVKTAFQYQEQNLQESFADAGFDALEDMLSLMEANADAYTAWNASPERAKSKKYFITGGLQFTDYYQIYRSRQVYLAISYIMHRIENFQLKKLVGDDMFNDLKQNPTTDTNKELLQDYIYPAIALLTISKGLIERAVKIGQLGVTVGFVAPDRNRPSKEPAPANYVADMAKQLLADGNEYLSRMQDLIQANPTDYPLYVDPIEAGRLYNVNNTRHNKFFGA